MESMMNKSRIDISKLNDDSYTNEAYRQIDKKMKDTKLVNLKNQLEIDLVNGGNGIDKLALEMREICAPNEISLLDKRFALIR